MHTFKIAFLSVAVCVVSAGCGPSSTSDGTATDNVDSCIPGEQAACYSGPTDSLGTGPCTGGTKTCYDSGTWGACIGEVLPTYEICANQIDDDCDGVIDDIPAVDMTDIDGDGYTRCDGDCCERADECDAPAMVNPGAIEVVGASGTISADENCNGVVDEVLLACDDGLQLTSSLATDAAHAIDLCDDAFSGPGFGVIGVQYTRGNGTPFTPSAQHGIQEAFGPTKPRFGSNMLTLSTGAARLPNQPDSCGSTSCDFNDVGTAPTNFPQSVPGCPKDNNIKDDIALELTLRAPTNATGYSFDFRFYTFEYPHYICNQYNDQFVALVDPAPPGAINGNIAFDSMENPVGVNIAFFDVCGKPDCSAGPGDLAGTGFDTWQAGGSGATSWLRTQAPVVPGSEFTIRFVIWDTGDQNFDSTVLIDNFRWLAEPVGVGTGTID